MTDKKTGLALLREPFPLHQISKLPKATKQQTEAVKADFKTGIRCQLCGQWHHKDVVHLDYVGHAALTDRLLECDHLWNWEPVAFAADGMPAMDRNGGMWIKLTVCNVTRLGYGHADGKSGGDAVKEVIGDALRNAAMRFGAALDLWHKGDLHGPDDADDAQPVKQPNPAKKDAAPRDPAKIEASLIAAIAKAETAEALDAKAAQGTTFSEAWDWLKAHHADRAERVRLAFNGRGAALAGNADLGGDEVPF